VARHRLFSDAQASAAEQVFARIRDLGLRTVRLVVVDQHGVPRGKSLSADAALAAMSNGLDFSGAAAPCMTAAPGVIASGLPVEKARNRSPEKCEPVVPVRARPMDLSGGAHDRSKPLTGRSQPVREMLSALAVVAGRPSAR